MELDAGGSYRSLSAVDVSPIVPRWVRGSFGVTGVTAVHRQIGTGCGATANLFERWVDIVAKTESPERHTHARDEYETKGAAVYTPSTLALYDLFVLGFSNSMVWKCPSHIILDFYDEHIADKHLDCGVGTGYFLDRCRFPSTAPTLALFDLNPHSLAITAKRLRRYAPSCHTGNVLRPIDIGLSGFDSIGLNYLLHCLPGNLESKSIVFEHVKPLLRDGGVVFGSTILGVDVQHNFLAKKLMKWYNAKGIFGNLSDRQQDLEAGLKAHFAECTIRIEGCVALFSARKTRQL